MTSNDSDEQKPTGDPTSPDKQPSHNTKQDEAERRDPTRKRETDSSGDPLDGTGEDNHSQNGA
jgi:hypothetical protein